MLFAVWTDTPHRPTRDLDLLGFGDQSAEALTTVFTDVSNQEAEPDGMLYDASSITISDIRDDQEYHGHRLDLVSRLGNARVALQVDIGIGDAVVPPPREIDYPVLIGGPVPHLRAYAPETTIAEKLHAIVDLGIRNSRIKDYYDLAFMARTMSFDGEALLTAVRATFDRRRVELSDTVPFGLTEEFARDATKQTQWRAFARRGRFETAGGFPDVVAEVSAFLVPVVEAIAAGRMFTNVWRPGGPWK
jgi:hypothetical protein